MNNNKWKTFFKFNRCLTTEKEKVKRKILIKRDNRPIINEQREINKLLLESANQSGLDWRIVGATVLHRYPIITPDPEPWELDMERIQDDTAERRRKILMDKIGGTPAQLIPTANPSYEEIIASMPFEPASRITEADKTNDRRSPNRRLQDSLFLIVKRNRPDFPWQFPQGKLNGTESLRLTAERVIDRAVGKVNRFFISNAPSAHYLYRYPDSIQQKRLNFGAKVFFYRAQLISGTIKLETKLYKDYAWIARDEVEEYFDKETAKFLYASLPF